MDALLSRVELKDQDLKLVTACSLHISAKLNEKEVDIPALDHIWPRSVTFYSPLDVKLMEMFIMRHLDDDFYYLPVPLRILQAFLDGGVVFPEEDALAAHHHLDFAFDARLARHFAKVAHFIADFYLLRKCCSLTRSELRLLNVPANVAAAAILAVSRKVAGVEPVWSATLTQVTRVQLDELAEVANYLFDQYS